MGFPQGARGRNLRIASEPPFQLENAPLPHVSANARESVMRQIALRLAATACLAVTSTGCCILDFWSSSGNRAYNVDLGKIGSGEQVITSPNEGKPWQGDAIEQGFGH